MVGSAPPSRPSPASGRGDNGQMDHSNESRYREIESEIDNLHTSWSIYQDRERNGRDVHLHYPPALFLSMVKLIENLHGQEITEDKMEDRCYTTPLMLANFGASVFEWAQTAMKNGVLAANFTPCDCTEITDEDLQSLIGESNGSGEDRPD